MKKTLFQEKINYLFNELKFEGREKDFVAWFSEKGHNYSARKKVVINNWLLGEMNKNPYWKFDKFPISKENIDGVLAFPKHCFLKAESLEGFKNRVDSYGLHQIYRTPQKFEFQYKYIYYFNFHKRRILDAELNIKEEIFPKKEYRIEIIPHNLDFDTEELTTYTGSLKIDDDGDYFISTANNFETMTAYFLKNKSYTSTKLYGLALGLSYDKKIPLCNKNVITKERLSEQEKEKLYWILNETEYLISDESLNNTNENIQTKYFNKFYEKLENLNTFLFTYKRQLGQEIKDDTYLNIFYNTFFSLYETSKHTKADKRYWVSNKREAYKIFLESTAQKKESTCYIVNPIYDNYIYLFDKYSSSLIEANIQSAKKGLNIEHIFVVTRAYKITNVIQKIVKKLESNGIIINFVLLDEIKKLSIDSYDFLCTNHQDVALYRNIHAHKYVYHVTKSKDKIEKLIANHQEIKEISYPMNDFLIQQQHKDDDILNALVGKWYHY
ncbi:MAG TPA: hypothetical protein ENK66_07930, partial [Arcobacter sp.]|nr:hypothetical protein [Arcobacter sp.]